MCWVIGKANDLFHPRSVPQLQVKTLVAHFGLSGPTVSQRSKAILRAAGAPPSEPGWPRTAPRPRRSAR